jgi:hypothetical protein
VDVQSLKNYVRGHLELDDEDLPDTLLNPYLMDAFERTVAFDNRWPRYEKNWSVALVDGETTISLPADCNVPSLLSVISPADGYRLVGITQENAEAMFLTGHTTILVGPPVYYSIFGKSDAGLDQLQLWPSPDVSAGPYTLSLRGYRQPVWSEAASTIPDLDPRLHLCLAYYAMSLAYAQQEDEILEGVYMARWQRDLTQTAKQILAPHRHRPLVMNSGAPLGGAPSYVVVPPPPGWTG